MTYDKTHFAAAHARMRQAPLELTDADFSQLALIDASLEAQAREARKRAQLSVVESNSAFTPGGFPEKAPNARRALTVKHLHRFVDRFGDELASILKQTIVPLREKIQTLEAEITDLKARPMPKYCGVYQDGAAYSVGDLVTKAGGLWCCVDATTTPPGTGHGWRLIVKRGAA